MWEWLRRKTTTTTWIPWCTADPSSPRSSWWWGFQCCSFEGTTFAHYKSQVSMGHGCCFHSLGWHVDKDLLPSPQFATVWIFVRIGYQVCLTRPETSIFLVLTSIPASRSHNGNSLSASYLMGSDFCVFDSVMRQVCILLQQKGCALLKYICTNLTDCFGICTEGGYRNYYPWNTTQKKSIVSVITLFFSSREWFSFCGSCFTSHRFGRDKTDKKKKGVKIQLDLYNT